MAQKEATRPRPTRTRVEAPELRHAFASDAELDHVRRFGTVRTLPARGLLQGSADKRMKAYAAMAAWMAGIFTLIYLVGPIGMALLGWTGAIASFFPNLVAFGITASAILVLLEWARPEVYLDRERDPVLPFVAGSLISWSVLHNTVGALKPFAYFDPGELLAFLALNGLEFTLFGMIFATLVRNRFGAFVMGFGFQVAYIAAFLLGLALF